MRFLVSPRLATRYVIKHGRWRSPASYRRPKGLDARCGTPDAARQCRAGKADNIIVHSNADSALQAATDKAGSIRVPRAVLDHLLHLHGAEFKVLLVLGRQQARSGGREQKPFRYSIPQMMEDTGLCPRAISQAISRLVKHNLILRVAKHGALPNRYRVLLEPAEPQNIPTAKKPAQKSKRTMPARVEVKTPERAVPQERAGGRRRKESRPLLQVERPDLFRDFGIE